MGARASFIPRLWARRGILNVLLLPLSGVFTALAALRRIAYARGWLASVSVDVPLIVVGNITAGGSGKTPLVIWLVEHLRDRGHNPGVVSRGYGGRARGSTEVLASSLAADVGDEPLLIQRKTGAPVFVGRDRAAAAQALRARHPEVDVLVSDDGLQHYRLARALELAVVDATAGLGNGWPLPAGPLREPVTRLHTVDAVVQVVRGDATPRTDLPVPAWRVDYAAGRAWRLGAPTEKIELRALPARSWLAATGIGRPQGFFDLLELHRIQHRALPFPDHHAFSASDLPADAAVLMTEKDAVKCAGFAGEEWWAVELTVAPERGFIEWLDARLAQQQSKASASGGKRGNAGI